MGPFRGAVVILACWRCLKTAYQAVAEMRTSKTAVIGRLPSKMSHHSQPQCAFMTRIGLSGPKHLEYHQRIAKVEMWVESHDPRVRQLALSTFLWVSFEPPGAHLYTTKHSRQSQQSTAAAAVARPVSGRQTLGVVICVIAALFHPHKATKMHRAF